MKFGTPRPEYLLNGMTSYFETDISYVQKLFFYYKIIRIGTLFISETNRNKIISVYLSYHSQFITINRQ